MPVSWNIARIKKKKKKKRVQCSNVAVRNRCLHMEIVWGVIYDMFRAWTEISVTQNFHAERLVGSGRSRSLKRRLIFERNWNGSVHLRAKLGKNLWKLKIYGAIPTNHRRPWCNLNLLYSVRNKTGEEEDEVTFSMCERWLSVLLKRAERGNVLVLYTQLSAIHPVWVLLLRLAEPEQEAPPFFSLLSTENPNKLFLLIRLMLIWSGLFL